MCSLQSLTFRIHGMVNIDKRKIILPFVKQQKTTLRSNSNYYKNISILFDPKKLLDILTGTFIKQFSNPGPKLGASLL